MIIDKAVPEDFEDVYKLLLEFNNPSITKDMWRSLFINKWENSNNTFGYKLVDNGIVCGFLGLIFADRMIDGISVTTCNQTSWIVKKEYRNQSLFLLYKALEHSDCIFTNLTPNQSLWDIFKMLGFDVLDTHFRLFFPLSILSLFSNNIKIINKNEEILNFLSNEELKIYNDHINFDLKHFIIKSGNEHCYIIIKRRKIKHMNIAQVLYIGNNSLFNKFINTITTKLCFILGDFALYVGSHFLDEQKNKLRLSSKINRKTFVKGSNIEIKKMDFLYSEFC